MLAASKRRIAFILIFILKRLNKQLIILVHPCNRYIVAMVRVVWGHAYNVPTHIYILYHRLLTDINIYTYQYRYIICPHTPRT